MVALPGPLASFLAAAEPIDPSHMRRSPDAATLQVGATFNNIARPRPVSWPWPTCSNLCWSTFYNQPNGSHSRKVQEIGGRRIQGDW